jgi:hypothetical protein
MLVSGSVWRASASHSCIHCWVLIRIFCNYATAEGRPVTIEFWSHSAAREISRKWDVWLSEGITHGRKEARKVRSALPFSATRRHQLTASIRICSQAGE